MGRFENDGQTGGVSMAHPLHIQTQGSSSISKQTDPLPKSPLHQQTPHGQLDLATRPEGGAEFRPFAALLASPERLPLATWSATRQVHDGLAASFFDPEAVYAFVVSQSSWRRKSVFASPQIRKQHLKFHPGVVSKLLTRAGSRGSRAPSFANYCPGTIMSLVSSV